MKIVKCCACGTPCKVVGRTTMHYEPVWKEENARLRKALKKIANRQYFTTIVPSSIAIAKEALEGK